MEYRIILVCVYIGWSLFVIVLDLIGILLNKLSVKFLLYVITVLCMRVLFILIAWKFKTALKDAYGIEQATVSCKKTPETCRYSNCKDAIKV